MMCLTLPSGSPWSSPTGSLKCSYGNYVVPNEKAKSEIKLIKDHTFLAVFDMLKASRLVSCDEGKVKVSSSHKKGKRQISGVEVIQERGN